VRVRERSDRKRSAPKRPKGAQRMTQIKRSLYRELINSQRGEKYEKYIYYIVLLCLMESVTIKVEETMSKRMAQSMRKRGYSTKTEFIREAIRDKLEVDEHDQLIKEFMRFRGKSKKKTTNAVNKKVREDVAKQIAKEYGF
jgi:Arc/MetJ-type ribon-helix-helix transcriptional regulator